MHRWLDLNILAYDGATLALATNRWAGGAVEPLGDRAIEHFALDGTTPNTTPSMRRSGTSRRFAHTTRPRTTTTDSSKISTRRSRRSSDFTAPARGTGSGRIRATDCSRPASRRGS